MGKREGNRGTLFGDRRGTGLFCCCLDIDDVLHGHRVSSSGHTRNWTRKTQGDW